MKTLKRTFDLVAVFAMIGLSTTSCTTTSLDEDQSDAPAPSIEKEKVEIPTNG